jgi:hypothetical protein
MEFHVEEEIQRLNFLVKLWQVVHLLSIESQHLSINLRNISLSSGVLDHNIYRE